MYMCVRVMVLDLSLLTSPLSPSFACSENFPPTINSYPECHQVVVRAAAKVVGLERAAMPQKTMVAEDFSYFLHARPGWCG